jgi:hypothetical protein
VTRKEAAMDPELVAPCGMNCSVCSAYLAYSHNIPKERGKINHCEGCRPRGKGCAYLKMNCGKIGKGGLRFCYECADFPCSRLKKIDERYRKNYDASLIGNLREIKKVGVEGFLKGQRQLFECPRCKGTVSVHNGKCYDCDKIESWKG